MREGNGPPRATGRFDIVAALVLGMAGVAGAWCTYQASVWSGVQTAAFSRASALRIESVRHSTEAGDLRAIDLAMFMAWIDAYSAEDEPREAFYRSRFRDEFQPAFEQWLASEPNENSSAAPSPFALDSYRLEAEELAAMRLAESEERAMAAGEANAQSDEYVLNAAMMAMVLFIVGLAQQTRSRPVGWGMLVGVTVLLLIGLYNVFVFPRA